MRSQLSDGHLCIAELGPEILNGVKSDKGGDEQADQLDTGHEADAEASHEQPEEPLRLKAVLALTMELGPAERCEDGAEEQHGVEEDEAADRSVRVLAEDHESDKPDSGTLEVQLLRRPIRHRNAHSAPEGVELAHEGVVDLGRVRFTRLKLERPIVTGEVSAQSDEELSGRRLLNLLARDRLAMGEGALACTSK